VRPHGGPYWGIRRTQVGVTKIAFKSRLRYAFCDAFSICLFELHDVAQGYFDPSTTYEIRTLVR
jgi:hypothetical protein